MNKDELRSRTRLFAVRIIRFSDNLTPTRSGQYMLGQLIRAATSVGANYRAALRGKSRQDFHYKIKVVLEEADECTYWLELIQETQTRLPQELPELIREAHELTSIFSAASKTLSDNKLNSINLKS